MKEEFVEIKFVWIKKKKKVVVYSLINSNYQSNVSIEFLRDIVEVLIYILLPANEFRCVPARMLLRVSEILNIQRIYFYFEGSRG
jgi:hypothetical protein